MTVLVLIECAQRVRMSSLTDITNTKQTRYKSAETVFVSFYLVCEEVSVASDPLSINEFIVSHQNNHGDSFISNFGKDSHGKKLC